MPKRIVADPETGHPGTLEDHGKRVLGIYRYVAYVYGAGEIPYRSAESMAELRAKYWDPSQQALVIPFTGGLTYEFGTKLLSQTADTTMVLIRVEFQFPHEGPPPEVCSCGKLSFRHAVEYHAVNDRSDIASDNPLLRRFRAHHSQLASRGSATCHSLNR
jgi:hypothetical protein